MKVQYDDFALSLSKAHEEDAGFDIKTPEEFVLPAHGSKSINTGVHVQLPPFSCGLIVSKSGLNVMQGINSTGLIDEGYTGAITVKLYNFSDRDYTFKRGDKISQLVVLPIFREDIQIAKSIEGGPRGNNGFGSTGR